MLIFKITVSVVGPTETEPAVNVSFIPSLPLGGCADLPDVGEFGDVHICPPLPTGVRSPRPQVNDICLGDCLASPFLRHKAGPGRLRSLGTRYQEGAMA